MLLQLAFYAALYPPHDDWHSAWHGNLLTMDAPLLERDKTNPTFNFDKGLVWRAVAVS